MYHAHIIRYLLLVILFSLSRLYSAEIISGYIIDAKTGDPLPAANLQIEGTLRGAITNQDGKFNLEIEALPAAVLVSYIGYESERVMINTAAEKTLTIELNPVILEMEAIEVTAEDPAMNIMRKVIEKKKVWRKNLKTYQAEAYSRVSLSNDSGIVVIAESISRAFWDAEKGPREVILNKRQTGNIKDEHNLVAASYIPNFYDDDVEINGFKIIGVTHPDALDYYRFKLTGRRMRDDKIVYDIDVIPASILQPTFSGRIAVLDEDYALLNVDLRSNESILFPPPIQEWNIYYKQQFSNFGREFWLPVDVREDGDILIGITGLQFPKIKYNQLSHLNDYQVNIPLPDSLYKEEKIVFTDSAAVDSVDLFIDNPGVVPLTVEEDKAYEGIDSAMTIEKAFKPSGFLAGLVEIDDGSDKDDSTKSAFWKFMDHIDLQIWYNRVDALHAGLKPNFDLTKRIKLNFLGAYNTGSKKWAYGGGAAISFLKNKNLTAGISYEANTEAQFSSIYPVWLTSVLPLFAKDDYFDYYWREHFRTDFVYKCSKADLTMTAGFNHERHSSLIKTTDWNILGKTYIQRENPQITPGILRSAELKIAWEKERTPMGVVGNRYAEFTIERSADEFLQSDYNFTRYEGTIEWRLKTFLRRRLMMPNVLDVKIIGGYSAGNLPVQRFGGLDGNLYAFSPFGVFRTLNGKALRSDKYAALFWEHNFRTAPFELLGIKYLAKKGIGLILHGAHGRTWIDEDKAKDYPSWYPDSQKELHEIGLSVNSIFGFGRVDFTRRIDRKAFYVGFSFARMF